MNVLGDHEYRGVVVDQIGPMMCVHVAMAQYMILCIMLTCVYNMFVGLCIYVLTGEREREPEGGGPGDQDVMS